MICSPKLISEIFAYYLISFDSLFPIYSLYQEEENCSPQRKDKDNFSLSTSMAAAPAKSLQSCPTHGSWWFLV